MKQYNIEGVVFDLDGTLVDLGAHVDWEKIRRELKKLYLMNGLDAKIFEKVSQEGLLSILESSYDLFRFQGEKFAKEIKNEAYELVCDHENEACYSCNLLKGSKDVLISLKQKGMRIGLCTSNSQRAAENVLMYHNVNHLFDAVVGRTGKYKIKPSHEQLEECLRILGLEPSRCVMVGDSHKDVLAAKKLGMYTIVVPVYFSKMDKIRDAKVDIIIDNLLELPDALRKL